MCIDRGGEAATRERSGGMYPSPPTTESAIVVSPVGLAETSHQTHFYAF